MDTTFTNPCLSYIPREWLNGFPRFICGFTSPRCVVHADNYKMQVVGQFYYYRGEADELPETDTDSF